MKSVAISQSNYIPWKGYFDMINSVDEFIIYDDMQFTRRDWRNRNVIKTPNGPLWLTIPVKVKGKYFQKINETEVDGNDWAEKHWKSISMNYSKSAFFQQYVEYFKGLYEEASAKTLLTDVNLTFIKGICSVFDIKTRLLNSSDFKIIDGKTERLVDICIKAEANAYISGPAAKDYIDPQLFKDANLELRWMNYSSYPPYVQRFGEFTHTVSALDLIFNVGPEFKNYLKSFNGMELHEQ